MTTLIDVAKVAGVSRATVSLVCRGSPLVALKTRQKVERAMQEVGYVYNRSAANLRSASTNIVGLIIPDISNPIYSELLLGVEDVLTPLGKAVFIADTHESIERQNQFLTRMLEMRVDGLIISAVAGTPVAAFDPYRRIGAPVVQVLRAIAGSNFDFAGVNNRQGAYRATRHLLDSGHRHLAYVGSAVSPSVNRERYLGYSDALTEAGIVAEALPRTICQHSFGAAASSAKSLLEKHSGTTAVVCFNDILAFGTTLGVYELGMTPGRDISVIGFDDTEAAENWWPPLTTMSIESRQLGANAGVLLSERIKYPERPVCRMVSEAVLKVRSSTASI